MDAAEARRTAAKLASRLERAEATVHDARVAGARRRPRSSRRSAPPSAPRSAPWPPSARSPTRARPACASSASCRPRPEQAVVDEATARAVAAEEAARARRAARRRAEREYAELAHAATGAPRRLTHAELDALRSEGPAGPALLAEAIKALALARRTDNPQKLNEALTQVASAAVTWRDRL